MSLQSLLASSPILLTSTLVLAGPAAGASHAPGDDAVTEALRRLGLVDVTTVAPAVAVDLKYARDDNFMGEAVYGAMRRCYLRPEAAEKIARAQAELERRLPGARLLMYDCLRPRNVQRRMWSLVRGTPQQRYVARPDPGSMHNHGAAVDIGIIGPDGEPLDMGTKVDHFGALAQPRYEARYLREGKLTGEQVANRRLLRAVMTAAGYQNIRIEWWHFNAFGRHEIRRRFAIVEALPPEAVPRTAADTREAPAS